jgi:hypothetical protein
MSHGRIQAIGTLVSSCDSRVQLEPIRVRIPARAGRAQLPPQLTILSAGLPVMHASTISLPRPSPIQERLAALEGKDMKSAHAGMSVTSADSDALA